MKTHTIGNVQFFKIRSPLPPTPEGIIIPIKVIPKAGKNAILGWENGKLKIRIAAAPEKGEANDELISFLSKEFRISKSRVVLLSGKTSRHKRVCLVGVRPEQADKIYCNLF